MRAVLNSLACHQRKSLRLRRGFTLVELMVVVVIIAILIGLVLPAISGVRTNGRIAEVRNDIANLEQAITQFKVSYGVEPPSQITLYAVPTAWDARSRGLIRQLWPKFDFATCGGASDGTVFYPTGTGATTLTLNGSECLVFFLSGMVDPTSGGFVGFAKDPARPFAYSTGSGIAGFPATAAYNYITNRDGPYFTFKGAKSGAAFVDRLVDLDGDSMPEYLDPWPGQSRPYAYFNGTTSYQTAAMAPVNVPTDAPTPVPSWRNTDCMLLNVSGTLQMPHAYYASFDPTSPTASRPHKSNGIQIISPGADGEYGIGRLYNPTNKNGVYRLDKDNITNFAEGRLGY